VKARPTAADFNRLFLAAGYGRYPIFTTRSYHDFVRRNDIELGRSIVRFERGELVGALAFGQRGDRAWFGLIGVASGRRGIGLGKRLVGEAIAAVSASGARSIELEIVQRNARAQTLVEGFGFAKAGELVVWARRPSRRSGGELPTRVFSQQAVSEIAQEQPACWQREPRSVALAGHVALVRVPGAYAFVRTADGLGSVLDAGCSDARSARQLLDALDARVRYDLTLNNEPADSCLSATLRERGWRVVERQFRFVRSAA
jgi:GNAT superfamily N-acetyltransferase